MKVTNQDEPGAKAFRRHKGMVGSAGTRSPGITAVDSEGNEATAEFWTIVGAVVTDNNDETAVLTIGESAGEPSLVDFYAATLGVQYRLQVLTGTATAVLDFGTYTAFDITLTSATCTLSFTNPPPVSDDAGYNLIAQRLVILRQDDTGGRLVTWPASVLWAAADGQDDGTAPTLFTAADAVDVFLLTSEDGGGTWGASRLGGASLSSPLTTKGDLWGYDTSNARIPVGSDGYLLVADSTDAQGIVWENPETTGHYEVLMTGASPAEPLEDGSGTDWLYVWVS